MKELVFATTNRDKLREARSILGVEILGEELEIDEIQSTDPIEVTRKKARAYYEVLKKPLFVEDVSLGFEALKGLPGPYINDFSKKLGNRGLIDLISQHGSRNAIAQTTLVYIDADREQEFIGEVKGKITYRPRGENGFGWDPVFIPEGSEKTFAEMDLEEKNQYSMRARALMNLKNWLAENSTG